MIEHGNESLDSNKLRSICIGVCAIPTELQFRDQIYEEAAVAIDTIDEAGSLEKDKTLHRSRVLVVQDQTPL